MGRPKKEINPEQFKALMRLNPTLKDTAAFFEMSEDSIINKLEEHFGTRDFSAFREQNMVHTRFSLIRKAIQKAEGGDNTMMIFCLKNLCGWTDKPEDSKDNRKVITLNYNLGSKDESDKK